jgi:hypothetical protein
MLAEVRARGAAGVEGVEARSIRRAHRRRDGARDLELQQDVRALRANARRYHSLPF